VSGPEDPPQADEEILLDAEVPELRIALMPAVAPPPSPPLPRAEGFGDDEWAAHTPDGRLIAFLREPAARCHYDRVLLVDGARRMERPLPPWVYYEYFLALGRRLLLGGREDAWVFDWIDGALTPIAHEDDAAGLRVCWLDDDTPVAAGFRQIVIAAPGARVTLPCRQAVAAHAPLPGLLVVSDDDGSQWIKDGRVVARDWRTLADARDGLVISAGGDAFRPVVRAG
jgi:hypothetical protein